MHFASLDGEGIYGHNEVSSLEADRAIRKMLHAVKKQFAKAQATNSIILRFKGDHFIIADESIDPNIDYFIKSIQIENLKPDELKALSSFRVSSTGEILLDVVRMHKENAELTEASVKPSEESKNIYKKISRLKQYHPELKNLLSLISEKPEEEALILLGVLEESLFDPRLQKIAEKHTKKGFKVRVYNDMMDMQNHVVSDDSGLLKVDLASSLKSINGEKGFAEEAGDLFLTSVYDRMLTTLQEKKLNIEHVTNLRRWGDFYFIDDKGTCAQISRTMLKMFNETPYAVIKKNIGKKEKFEISFVKTPPEKLDQDTFVLPLMPIVGLDEAVKLQPIEEGTDILTADAIRINNEITFSTRLKVMDEEIRNMRPRLVSERLDKLQAVDLEFMLYKLFNPNDKKRGMVRLRKLLNASDAQIKKMQNLMEKINSKVPSESMTWERVNLIQEMMKSDSRDIRTYTNLMFDLTIKIVRKETYQKNHNGIKTLTVEGANTEEQEISFILDRLKPPEPTEDDKKEILKIRAGLLNLSNKKRE